MPKGPLANPIKEKSAKGWDLNPYYHCSWPWTSNSKILALKNAIQDTIENGTRPLPKANNQANPLNKVLHITHEDINYSYHSQS